MRTNVITNWIAATVGLMSAVGFAHVAKAQTDTQEKIVMGAAAGEIFDCIHKALPDLPDVYFDKSNPERAARVRAVLSPRVAVQGFQVYIPPSRDGLTPGMHVDVPGMQSSAVVLTGTGPGQNTIATFSSGSYFSTVKIVSPDQMKTYHLSNPADRAKFDQDGTTLPCEISQDHGVGYCHPAKFDRQGFAAGGTATEPKRKVDRYVDVARACFLEKFQH